MDNNKIICNDCGTENEEKYDYCKNCGAKLEKISEKPPVDPLTGYPPSSENLNTSYQAFNNGNSSQPNYNYQQNSDSSQQYTQQGPVYGNTYVDNIDGIPYSEVASFVGKKAESYMPVFSKIEITGSKTGWHWPTAILSFFIGPLGTALWFFYRKMYKIAAILVAIGIITTVASAVIIGPVATSVDIFDILFNFSGEELPDSELLKEAAFRSEIANLITGIIGLACTVVCGMFTHNWYKDHIHKSILKYRASNVDMRYYQIGLMSIGGTSGGMLALGLAIMFFTENITTIIYTALSTIK